MAMQGTSSVSESKSESVNMSVVSESVGDNENNKKLARLQEQHNLSNVDMGRKLQKQQLKQLMRGEILSNNVDDLDISFDSDPSFESVNSFDFDSERTSKKSDKNVQQRIKSNLSEGVHAALDCRP